MTRSLRWGILSTARIAVNSIIPAIRQSSNGTVVAIASRTQAKADEVGMSLAIPNRFPSYEKMLDSTEVEAVYIPLPNGLHMEWVIRAAEKGKHVLCEKPISTNATECQRMIDACREHGVLLMEAFMYRFHPQTITLRRLLDDEIVGRVSVVRSSFTISLSNLEDIRYQRNLGGGSLLDVGSYCVNVTRLVARDEPTEVHAMARLDERKNVDVSFAGLIRFKRNLFGIFDCGFRSPYRHHLEIEGDKGTLEVPNPFNPRNPPTIFLHNGGTKEIVSENGNMYKLMIEHFSDCVLQSHTPAYTTDESLKNMQLIDELVKSSEQNTIS